VSSRLKGELIHPNKTAWVDNLQFSPDGKRILAGDRVGGVVVVWDVATGERLTTVETGLRIRPVAHVVLPPPFAVSADLRTLFAPRGKREYERVVQDGKPMSRWTFDGEVRAWSLDDGKLRRTYKHRPPRGIGPIQLSPDGTRLITSESLSGTYERAFKSTTSVWDVRSGEYRALDGPAQDLSGGKFSPDGRSFASVLRREAQVGAQARKLTNLTTGRDRWSVPVTEKNASAWVGAFSPDGRVLFGTVLVLDQPNKWDRWRTWVKWWDAATGGEVASFEGDPNSTFGDFCPSPDSRTLGVLSWCGEKMKLLLYSIPEKRLLRTVTLCEKTEGQRSIASGLTFHPGGKWLAVITRTYPEKAPGDIDPRDLPQPRVLLIETARGKIRETLVAPQSFANNACFSPDGRTLATGGLGRVILWDMARPPGEPSGAAGR
jgi:WD40 repeat protein